jgi:hypothetical protein
VLVLGLPFLLAGMLKAAYDGSLWLLFRHVQLQEAEGVPLWENGHGGSPRRPRRRRLGRLLRMAGGSTHDGPPGDAARSRLADSRRGHRRGGPVAGCGAADRRCLRLGTADASPDAPCARRLLGSLRGHEWGRGPVPPAAGSLAPDRHSRADGCTDRPVDHCARPHAGSVAGTGSDSDTPPRSFHHPGVDDLLRCAHPQGLPDGLAAVCHRPTTQAPRSGRGGGA